MRYVLVLLAVLAFGFAACDDDEEGGVDGVTPVATEGAPEALACTGESTLTSGDGPPPVEGEPMTTDSGLQILDIIEGEGAEAQAGGMVCVHYTGWLEDGAVFDSSVERGEPVSFALSGLIAGWQEGIPGMKVGGTRRLIIPPELAYGEAGSPPAIPANATLTFDIELLEVQ